MFSTRDQENVAHAHRQAAASKPLNQQAPPKTPGPNGRASIGRQTVRKPLNDDENRPLATGKGKFAIGKDASAFITPGPRDRAPLGAKTTNAKAKPFQTPALLTNKQPPRTNKTQQRSASARKPKLKVHHQPEQVLAVGPVGDVKQALEEDDDDVPDIEYAPAKLPDLPDYPDPDDPLELRADEDFKMFSKENYMRDALQHFYNPIGDDGISRVEREARKQAEDDERYFSELEAEMVANAMETDLEREWRLEREIADRKTKAATSQIAGRPTQALRTQDCQSPMSTLTARTAAAALSSHVGKAAPKTTVQTSKPGSSFAAPTAASAARKSSALPSAATPINAPLRNTPGTLASRSTLGYASGRKVSATRKAQQLEQQQNEPFDGLGEDDKSFLRRRRAENERSERLMRELLPADSLNRDSKDDDDPLAHLWQDDNGFDGGLDSFDDRLGDIHLDPAMFGVHGR